MFAWIFYGLLFYFLFKLLVNIILPLVMTTRKVKQQFNSMKQNAENQRNTNSSNTQKTSSSQQKKAPLKDDYIDFEEIKN
jgi:uncharacterized membrane protein YgaE (UPF0421/DUF939 family)